MPATRRSNQIHEEKMKLLQSDLYEEWQLSLNSPSTRENYSNHLAYFCKFHNCTPIDLKVKDAEELKTMVKKYLLQLKKNAKETPGRVMGEVHVNSLPVYISGVYSFIDYLEKDINWKKINKILPEQIASEVRAYTREEIQKLLAVASDPYRVRALELIMAAGGPRRQVFEKLKVSNFEMFDEQYGIGMIWLYARSKKWRYFTLLTPEATDALRAYLKWREERGEKPLSPDAPLIRDKFDVFTARRLKPKFLKPKSIYAIMKRQLERAGISDVHLAPDHSFRHFFDTMLLSSNVNDKMKSYWMGHKAGLGLDTRYFDPKNPDAKKRLLEEYLKAVDLLTINNENRLKRENVQLKEKVDDISVLKARLDSQEQTLKEYTESVGSLEDVKAMLDKAYEVQRLLESINKDTESKRPKEPES